MEKLLGNEVLIRTTVENADKMLEELGRATELISELKEIFYRLNIKSNINVAELDDNAVEKIAEKVAEKLKKPIE